MLDECPYWFLWHVENFFFHDFHVSRDNTWCIMPRMCIRCAKCLVSAKMLVFKWRRVLHTPSPLQKGVPQVNQPEFQPWWFFALFPTVYTPSPHLERNYRYSGQIRADLGVENYVWQKSATWTCEMVFKSLVVTPGCVCDVLRVFLLIFMTCRKSCFFMISRVTWPHMVHYGTYVHQTSSLNVLLVIAML